ncbi:MAG: PilZ domain-containing protein, partial [Cyanobacteriota bacterium]
SPPCRLRLEGEGSSEASCEILELSSEGVNIVISGGERVRQGQHGRLLIGPPEGDHYELPVDVSWVKPASSIAVLGLSLCTPPHWRFARS